MTIKIKQIAMSFLILFSLFTTSCSNENSVDSFLNDYEKVVVKWEEKANDGELTFNDLAEIQKETMKLAEREEKLKDLKADELTAEQQQKMYDLVTRLTAVTTKISN